MPEPTIDDVVAYTNNRLADDDVTAAMLATALAAARNYCGWHVTPVSTDHTVTLNGSGGPVLALPTKALLDVTAVTEDGVDLDVETLEWTAPSPYPVAAVISKQVSFPGSRYWTDRYSGIAVTMDDGFADAPAFNAAVLQYVDQMSLVVGVGGSQIERTIDDVTYRWAATGPAGFPLNESLLDGFRLVRLPL